MTNEERRFRMVDILYLTLAILPMIFAVVLNILTKPYSEEISVSGARIFLTLSMPFQDLPITESQVNSWMVLITLFWICRYLTHGIAEKPGCKRQLILEWIVEQTDHLVKENMGSYFTGFAPFIAAIMALSALSSLCTLLGLYPPTSDINVVGGWAILVFVLITYYKMKCGPIHYMKSFTEPIAIMTPMNVISEIATPVSMSFRHYGNVLSGTVVSTLVAAALQGISKIVLGWLPGALGTIPFLQVGIPAILSLYFDLFSGLLQAFIFAMLTMLYVAGGFPQEDYEIKQKMKKTKAVQMN